MKSGRHWTAKPECIRIPTRYAISVAQPCRVHCCFSTPNRSREASPFRRNFGRIVQHQGPIRTTAVTGEVDAVGIAVARGPFIQNRLQRGVVLAVAVSFVITKSPGLSTYSVAANTRRSSKASKKYRLFNQTPPRGTLHRLRPRETDAFFRRRRVWLRLSLMGSRSPSTRGAKNR